MAYEYRLFVPAPWRCFLIVSYGVGCKSCPLNLGDAFKGKARRGGPAGAVEVPYDQSRLEEKAEVICLHLLGTEARIALPLSLNLFVAVGSAFS